MNARELPAGRREREAWSERMAKSAFRSGCAAGFAAGLLAANRGLSAGDLVVSRISTAGEGRAGRGAGADGPRAAFPDAFPREPRPRGRDRQGGSPMGRRWKDGAGGAALLLIEFPAHAGMNRWPGGRTTSSA